MFPHNLWFSCTSLITGCQYMKSELSLGVVRSGLSISLVIHVKLSGLLLYARKKDFHSDLLYGRIYVILNLWILRKYNSK